MPQLNQKGVIQLAAVLVLLAGLASSVYLISRGEPLKWFPKAFEIQSLTGSVPSPTPITSGLEIGLEAGEQHDTSRVWDWSLKAEQLG